MSGAPIIVAARFGPADFAWLDGLRRAHFPPERNQLPAHLTLFHHLPPSAADELDRRLRAAANGPPPAAMIDRVMLLGRGVAFGVQAPDLIAIRAALAEAFTGLLTPQDAVGWRPHVTIQNKVTAAEAKALYAALHAGFTPRPLTISGLSSFFYRGGPWEPIADHAFRGVNRSGRSRRS